MALKKKPILVYTPARIVEETSTYYVPYKPRECTNVTETVTTYTTVIERYIDDEGVAHTFILVIPSGTSTETKRVCTEAVAARTVTTSTYTTIPGGLQALPDANWNAASRSITRLTGDGSYVFTVKATSTGVISGLTEDYDLTPVTEIPWAFLFDNGAYTVLDRGKERIARAAFTDTTEFKITVTSGVVTYLVDDVLVYTSLNEASGDLFADAAMYLADDEITTYSFTGTFIDTNDTTADVYGAGSEPAVLITATEYSVDDPLEDFAFVYGTSSKPSVAASTVTEITSPAGAWVQAEGVGALALAFGGFIHPGNILGESNAPEVLITGAEDDSVTWADTFAMVYGSGGTSSVNALSYNDLFDGDDGEVHSFAVMEAPFATIAGHFNVNATELRQAAPSPTIEAYTASVATVIAPFATVSGMFTVVPTARLQQAAPFPTLEGRYNITLVSSLEQEAPFATISAFGTATLQAFAPFPSASGVYSIGTVARLEATAPFPSISAEFNVGVVFRLDVTAPFPVLAPVLQLQVDAPFALVSGSFYVGDTPANYSYSMNVANQAVTRYTNWNMHRYSRLYDLELALENNRLVRLGGVDDDGTIITCVAELAPIVTDVVTRLAALYLDTRADALIVEVTHGERAVDRYAPPLTGKHRKRAQTRRGYKDTLWSVTLRNKDGGPLEVGSVEAALEETTRRYG